MVTRSRSTRRPDGPRACGENHRLQVNTLIQAGGRATVGRSSQKKICLLIRSGLIRRICNSIGCGLFLYAGVKLLGLAGLGLFALACHRYVVQALNGQSLHLHVPGRFDNRAHSLQQITLDDAVQVHSWQLSWVLCLCFSRHPPQWVFVDEVDAGTFAALNRLVKVVHI